MNKSSPNVVAIAGPNGSGKSTAAPALLRDYLGMTEFVNADIIGQGLSGFGSENVAMQAGRIMLERLKELLSTPGECSTTRATKVTNWSHRNSPVNPCISKTTQSGTHSWKNTNDAADEPRRNR